MSWLLVIWFHGYAFIHLFDTQAECREVGEVYQRTAPKGIEHYECQAIDVPPPRKP